jgi:hypothetical protein
VRQRDLKKMLIPDASISDCLLNFFGAGAQTHDENQELIPWFGVVCVGSGALFL